MKPRFTTRGFLLAYLYGRAATLDEIEDAFNRALRMGIVLGTRDELLPDLRFFKAGGWIRETPDGRLVAPPEEFCQEDRSAVEEESRLLRGLLGG